MERFTVLTAVALPLDESGVDTDQLCPARFVKVPYGEGYDRILLHDRRFREDGSEREDFVFNDPAYRSARILVAGRNFGIGSSRESAVAALEAWGFRAVIAPSFGDILFDNCFRRGLLPVVLPDEEVARILAWLRERPGREITVDLERTAVSAGGRALPFDVSPMRRTCLLEGLDELTLTGRFADRIAAYEREAARARPWLPISTA